jgi:hypothetical protein
VSDAEPAALAVEHSLFATWSRCALSAAASALVVLLASVGWLAFTHSTRTLASLTGALLPAWGALSLLALLALRAEDARLARELRTARIGSAALRSLVARRQRLPFVARAFSSGLGSAALALANGDPAGARDALATASPLMRGGSIEPLRAVVEADLDRANGTGSSLDRSIAKLRSIGRMAHHDVERYRIHVLTKAVLARGDADAAVEIASDLVVSPDEDLRVYATWLRAWFELDGDPECSDWPSPGEGLLRRATLVARANGAEALVDKLNLRILAIARSDGRG